VPGGRAARLGLLTLAAFVVRVLVSWTDHPLGTDGYYYIVQIEDLVRTGELHVPDSSWVLRVLALPHALGAPAIASLAWASAALAAAAVPAAYLLGAHRSPRHGELLAALTAASPTLTHLGADFPKNLGAVAPLVGLLAAMAAHRRGVRHAWIAAVVLGGLAATAHRLGAVLVLAVLVASACVRRVSPRALALVAVAGAAFVAATTMLPGLLHPADLHRVTGQLRTVPWPPAPFAFLPLRPTHPAEVVELSTAWLAVLATPIAWRRDRVLTAWALALLLPALFPWWRHDALDLGYRCHLLGPVGSLAMATAALPDALAAWVPRAAWLALPAATVGFDPALQPPYERYERMVQRLPRPLPELLIAHQGLNFLYDHQTGHEAMAWAPEPELSRQQIGRIAWGIRPGEWRAVLRASDPAVVTLGDRYHYVREDVWESLVQRAMDRGDDELLERIEDPRNPTRIRPAALTRNRSGDRE